MNLTFNNLMQLQKHFKNEMVCMHYLEQQRWNGQPACPHCGSVTFSRVNTRFKHPELKGYKDYRCKDCDKKYTVLTGTFFQGTKIELKKWIAALYLLSAHKKGISSLQLSRDLGITQKTAWFINHRLREMLKEPTPTPLEGAIEIDETFVGGKEKNKHGYMKNRKVASSIMYAAPAKYNNDKFPVFGMLERNGKVRVRTVKDTKGKTLIPIIVENCVPKIFVFSDEHTGYSRLAKSGFIHQTVKHKDGEYVNGITHTQNIENFWSMFKRGYIGIYHYMSEKHLQRYCDEFAFRYNTRQLDQQSRFDKAASNLNGRLRYKHLIKN